MPKKTVNPLPATATQLVAADPTRLSVHFHNKTNGVTLYVNQNASLTTSSGGNKVLMPGDAVEFEGVAATAAWSCITDTVVPETPTVRVTENKQ